MQIQRLGLEGFGSQILINVEQSSVITHRDREFNFITFDEMICNMLLTCSSMFCLFILGRGIRINKHYFKTSGVYPTLLIKGNLFLTGSPITNYQSNAYRLVD